MAERYGLRFGAARFVAGESLVAATRVVRRINREGMTATLDVLGENVETEQQAVQTKLAYMRTLKHLHRLRLESTISLKLTALGLDLHPEFCYDQLRQIVSLASDLGNFVRIDMEDSHHLPATLEIFRRIRQEYEQVGTVIQAYLYRSESDLRALQQMGANLRLVKGAYREPPQVAFPDKRDVDANFRKLIELQLNSGCFCAIATHDDAIIGWALEYIRNANLSKERYEFQMLYGIRPGLQRELVEAGQPLRIYIPYGRSWYPYFMRRLAERPENVKFVLRGLLRP